MRCEGRMMSWRRGGGAYCRSELANNRLKQEIEQRKLADERLKEKNLELENANRQGPVSGQHEPRTANAAQRHYRLYRHAPYETARPLTDDQESQLQTIQSSAKHLLSLINDLLDIAKIESGKVDIRTESVDVVAVIREVVNTLKPMAEEKGLVNKRHPGWADHHTLRPACPESDPSKPPRQRYQIY